MNTPSRLPRLLTVKEAAHLLHVSTRTIDRWRLDGMLPFLKLGRLIRIAESELEALMRSGRGGHRR